MKTIVKFEGVTLDNPPKPGDIIFLPEDGRELFLVLSHWGGRKHPSDADPSYAVFSLEKKYKGTLFLTQFSSWCFFQRA